MESSIIGMTDVVKLCAYQPEWARIFQIEHDRLLEALGKKAINVQHIGSTAIPEMEAKPVIDILVGVESIHQAEKHVEPLSGLGYQYLGENGIPGRHYFIKKQDDRETHHLHMVEIGGDHWARHLFFRDYLREHPAAAHAYIILKRRLADLYQHDQSSYSIEKTEFIQEIEGMNTDQNETRKR